MAKTTHTGRCACGSVTFTVAGELTNVSACHCRTCRRTSGYFWGATHTDKNALTIHNTDTLMWWASSNVAERGFCGRCGSSLFYCRHDVPHIAIAAGTLDDPSGLSTTTHIFCAEAGDYYHLDDSTQCYPGFD